MKRSTIVAAGCALLACLGCTPLSKMDGWNVFARDTFSLPARTLDTIPIRPGMRVADLGAGRGYFTWPLSAAVGADGIVWAVEVEDDLADELRRGAEERGLSNVRVVRAEYDDSKLPDASADVVLLSTVYHHIESRVAYMTRLRRVLAPGGRVAILEPRAGWESWLILLPPGHGVPVPTIRAEMEAAGYRLVASHDFLPSHSFEVFEAK